MMAPVDVRAELRRVIENREKARAFRVAAREAGTDQRHLDPATTVIWWPCREEKRGRKKETVIKYAAEAMRDRLARKAQLAPRIEIPMREKVKRRDTRARETPQPKVEKPKPVPTPRAQLTAEERIERKRASWRRASRRQYQKRLATDTRDRPLIEAKSRRTGRTDIPTKLRGQIISWLRNKRRSTPILTAMDARVLVEARFSVQITRPNFYATYWAGSRLEGAGV